MSFLYVPGSPDLTLESISRSQVPEPSASWRGKPLQLRSLWRAWKTYPWLRRLSGLISPRSMEDPGVAQWIASVRATHVSPSPSPEDVVALMTPGTCGPMSRASFLNAEQLGLFSRTFPAICPLASMKSAENFTAWVSSLRLEYSARQRLVRHIAANACSSWPTATVSDGGGATENRGVSLPRAARDASEIWVTPDAGLFNGGEKGDHLTISTQAQESWPTPRTITGGGESGDRKQELGREESGGGDLQSAAEGWPTPRVGSGGAHHENPDTLPSRVDTWQTPRVATAGVGASPGELKRDVPSIGAQAEQWQSPTVGDVAGGHLSRGGDRSEELLLNGQAEHWPTPVAGDDGHKVNHTSNQPGLIGAAHAWDQRMTASAPPARQRQQQQKTGQELEQIPMPFLEAWATPTARDWKGDYTEEGLTRSDGKSRMDMLATQSSRYGPLDQAQTGPGSQNCSGQPSDSGKAAPTSGPKYQPTRRKLNPMFTEWLMGWPAGWTDFAPVEMEWSHWLQRMRSELSRLPWLDS